MATTCPDGTVCDDDAVLGKRCVPETGVSCSDDGTTALGVCGNSIEVCAQPKRCVDGECKDCSCAQGDCCSDGCTPDPNGIACSADPCQVCDGLGQCVPAKDGDNPGDRCPGDQKCRDGQCGSGNCGDGERNAGEACDDGNNVSGDGCSADCKTVEYKHNNGQGKIWYNNVPTGTMTGNQAKLSCEKTYGNCHLCTGDCAGHGYCQGSCSGRCWGWQSGCSGGSGRIWPYGSSYTTYGTWN